MAKPRRLLENGFPRELENGEFRDLEGVCGTYQISFLSGTNQWIGSACPVQPGQCLWVQFSMTRANGSTTFNASAATAQDGPYTQVATWQTPG